MGQPVLFGGETGGPNLVCPSTRPNSFGSSYSMPDLGPLRRTDSFVLCSVRTTGFGICARICSALSVYRPGLNLHRFEAIPKYIMQAEWQDDLLQKTALQDNE